MSATVTAKPAAAAAPATATNGSAPAAHQAPAQNQLFRGTVKQINSADTVVIKSLVVKDGRNLEKTVMIGGINVPRLGRRINPSSPDSTIENDQVRFCFFFS
jgi:hypothetical protein